MSKYYTNGSHRGIIKVESKHEFNPEDDAFNIASILPYNLPSMTVSERTLILPARLSIQNVLLVRKAGSVFI